MEQENDESEQERSLNPKKGFLLWFVVWHFGGLNLKTAVVSPADTGTDGASIICCYKRLICLQCCIHVHIHVQMYWVFYSVAQDWVNLEKMSVSLVYN